jgi:hypothetical protein
MNKQIWQLAERAGATHKLNLGVHQFYTSELEQFVDSLIVDCAQYMDSLQGSRDVPKFAWQIMDRYGVSYERYVDEHGHWQIRWPGHKED